MALGDSQRLFESDAHGSPIPESDPEPAHRAGDLVDDKYELLELLGSGGMSHVWRARDYVLNIDVALKIIRPRDSFPGALQRLLCEARAAVSVSHPSIVRVLAFGLKGEDAYIAMELLEGETLEDVLWRTRVLPHDEAVSLLLPIARALEAAHRHGVIHRDVKPANILLAQTESGGVVPKLLDFGIARAQLPLPRRLTGTGQVMGTPHYMSPEQASGRADIDHRADIWGLSAVLYEAISGVPPFDGDNYNALMWAVLVRPLTPLWQVSAADPELCALVHRGLEKNPVARYASAGELAEAMEVWLSHPRAPWPEGSTPRTSPRAITQTAVMAVPPLMDSLPPAVPRRRWRSPSRRAAALSTWLPTLGLGSLLVSAAFAFDAPDPPAAVVAGVARTVRGVVAEPARPLERLTVSYRDLPMPSTTSAQEPANEPVAIRRHERAKNETATALPLPMAPEF